MQSFVAEGHDIIAVPVRVQVPQQAVPIFFTLRASLTHARLDLGLDSLDLGACFVNERLSLPLSITNRSLLPLKYGFVGLPSALEVQPADGFGVLLPRERKDVRVIFKPDAAVEHKLSLTVRTTLGNIYRLPVTGQGLDPPITFSATVLSLVPAAIGDQVTADLTLTNASRSRALRFHLGVPFPHLSRLTVAPSAGTLAQGQSTRVELVFTAAASRQSRERSRRSAAETRTRRDSCRSR